MKRLIGFIATALLALSITPAVADQWAPSFGLPGQVGLSLTDASMDSGVSSLAFHEERGPNQFLCSEVGKAPCDKPNMRLYGALILPKCETEGQENCVEALEVIIAGQSFIGEFVEYAPGSDSLAVPSMGLPAGKTVGKWKVAGANHAGGTDEYAVSVALRTEKVEKGKVRFESASLRVMPYKTISGSYRPVEIKQEKFDDGISFVSSTGTEQECAWTASGSCGRNQDFAPETVVKLTVRLTSQIGGWFNGRMKSPDIRIAKHSASSNKITVSGEPASVSRLGFSVARDQATPELLKMFESSRSDVTGISVPANQDGSFDYVAASRKQLSDTASGETTTWSIQTVRGEGNRCLSDTSKVLGIVTTNAMAYQAGAPTFSRGTLSYQVSGLHLRPGGAEPVLGTYDLVMRSDTARCLYRFSKAPVSASISVTGEGDKNIATTVLGETNGWLKLAAYGFTFSKKTIQVKLSQKRTTITCVSVTNPKKTRKVTAIGPKCPTGFTLRK